MFGQLGKKLSSLFGTTASIDSEKKSRLFVLQANTMECVDRMKGRMGVKENAHVLRSALYCLDLVSEELSSGGRVILRSADGHERDIVIQNTNLSETSTT